MKFDIILLCSIWPDGIVADVGDNDYYLVDNDWCDFTIMIGIDTGINCNNMRIN